MRHRRWVCLLACLLLCGCVSDEQAIKEDTAAVIGDHATAWQDIEAQLSQMQEQLATIDQKYRELQEQLLSQKEQEKPSDELDTEGSIPTERPQTPQKALYTYQTCEDGVILTKYLGAATDVVVPGAIDGKCVIGLADSAFAGTAVRRVELPATVRTLGWFTFYGCSSLESVSIPASVQSIGYASFDGCAQTLTLTVSEGSYAQKFAASFALRYITP